MKSRLITVSLSVLLGMQSLSLAAPPGQAASQGPRLTGLVMRRQPSVVPRMLVIGRRSAARLACPPKSVVRCVSRSMRRDMIFTGPSTSTDLGAD